MRGEYGGLPPTIFERLWFKLELPLLAFGIAALWLAVSVGKVWLAYWILGKAGFSSSQSILLIAVIALLSDWRRKT